MLGDVMAGPGGQSCLQGTALPESRGAAVRPELGHTIASCTPVLKEYLL